MSKVTVNSGILDEKEFTQVKKEQDKVNSILAEIGYIKSKKHALLHEWADTNAVGNKTKKVLEEKYGSISIDLLTGKWKRVNDKEDV